MNAKVAAIIERIKEGGYTVKSCEPLSPDRPKGKLWITAERLRLCPLYPVEGHPMLNESLYGWIGPRGAFEFHYAVGTYHDKFNEWWRLRGVTEPKKTEPVTLGEESHASAD